MSWADVMIQCLKSESVRLAVYVPDSVLAPLIQGMETDPSFRTVVATREDEAIAIACGANMGGLRAVVLMQSSGFGNIPNSLASLAMPYQIPVLFIISERGMLNEFNSVQVQISRAMRPTLDALNVMHHTLSRPDELESQTRRALVQCFRTRWPTALILSPLLTGG